MRTRPIALAASICAHAALAALVLGAAQKARPLRAPRISSPIALVPFTPKEAVAARLEAGRDEHEAPSPKDQGHSRRSRSRAHAQERAPRGGAADSVPEAAGPRVSPDEATPPDRSQPGAGTTRDLSNVDLELHASAPTDRAGNPIPQRRIPTIGVEVSPGGGGGAGSLTPSGDGTYVHRDTQFYGHVGRDGTVDFEGHGRSPTLAPSDDQKSFAGKIPLDVTDMFLGAAGDDPYAYDKRKFMDATRGFRQMLYDRACKEQLADAVLDIRPQLETIWKNDKLTASQRRLFIFQLWDQCDENGPPDIQRATAQIRAVIVDFIQDKMPKAGEYAYSDADLESLNRIRRSAERFAPYE